MAAANDIPALLVPAGSGGLLVLVVRWIMRSEGFGWRAAARMETRLLRAEQHAYRSEQRVDQLIEIMRSHGIPVPPPTFDEEEV